MSSTSREDALERLRQKRKQASSGSATTKKLSRRPSPKVEDIDMASPPPPTSEGIESTRILAPASSPVRQGDTHASPDGISSKYFAKRNPSHDKTFNDSLLGDDHVGSLTKKRQDAPNPSRSAMPVASSPDPLGMDNRHPQHGQAPKKRPMLASREGSDYASSVGTNDMSRLKVDNEDYEGGSSRAVTPPSGSTPKMKSSLPESVPETPTMPTDQTRQSEPNSRPQLPDMSSRPIHLLSSSSSIKRPPAPSSSSSPQPQVSTRAFKTLYPSLSESQIEQALIAHADEDRKVFVMRLQAMSEGKEFTPPKPKVLGGSGSSGAGIARIRTPGAMSASGTIPAKYLPATTKVTPVKGDMKQKSAIYANRRKDVAPPIQEPITVSSGASTPANGSATGTKRRRGSESGSEVEWSDEGEAARKDKRTYGVDEVEDMNETSALEVFNTCEVSQLTGTIVCSEEQAQMIISMRPFTSVQDLRKRLQKKRGVSQGLFDQYIDVMQGYIQVDRCLSKCESIGKEVLDVMRIWKGKGNSSGTSTPNATDLSEGFVQDTGMHIANVDGSVLKSQAEKETDPKKRRIMKMYKSGAPAGLAPDVKLKNYQTVGINWLSLMYDKELSCILADEMGLGKTFQVIAFLAGLKAKGKRHSHLIIVPSSTLENWVREFQRFAPEIDVQTYYGSQKDREEQRYQLKDQFRAGELEVVLTTYDLAFREQDQKFLRKKLEFECCIYDEGHTLKNFNSMRYNKLIEIKPRWRLLLTGTPLQNNLQELVSLLKFIHEDIFEDAEASLRQIFKVHAKGASNLLSAQRVSRARTMMTPFVLRRRKAQVLKDLPAKSESKVSCIMESAQKELYDTILERSRNVLANRTEEELEQLAIDDDDDEEAKATKKAKAKKDAAKNKENASSNILMDLRKAALHPLLFRRIYSDSVIRKMARDCMREEEFEESNYDLIVEDMEVMTDSELHNFAKRYKSVNKYVPLCEDAFMKSAKVKMLADKLKQCDNEDRRMLCFSQFTQVLDILGVVLDKLGVRYMRLDGSTKVDERQSMVDQFTEDEGIQVFLLSTRAGGMGINLVAASMVVIFDQDFNPHNDKQAMDRAYRIGQTRDVLVYKFITEGTIEEEIYTLGETKLQLDNAVGGAANEVSNNGASSDKSGKGATKTANPGLSLDAEGRVDDRQATTDTKKSLMKTIRQRVVAGTK